VPGNAGKFSFIEIETSSAALRKRLLWVMLLRVALLTVLLGTTIMLNYREAATLSSPSPRFLLVLVAVTYLITIVYALWYRLNRAIGLLAQLQLLADLVLWGCVAYATGGVFSGFTTLFDLWVIVWAVVLGGRAAFHAAIFSSIVISAMGYAMFGGTLLPLPDQAQPEISLRELIYSLGVNISALFLVATLVHSLVQRLESTGRGLQAERIKRADLAQLHTDMIRSLTVGIATCDLDGRVITMNPAGLDMLKLDMASAEGELLAKWFPELKQQLKASAAIRSRGRGTAVNTEGDSVPIDYIVAPLTSAGGSAEQGFILVFSDLTEVRRLESALEKSRRLAALGELAASLAHEIRNPLGALSGAFQILSSSPNLGEEDRSLVDIITREIQRMELLVTDVLDYARPKRREVGSVNLTVLIGEVVKTFVLDEEACERMVEQDVEDGLQINADGGQIRQVLWNLLTNALQATEPGDRITVVAEGKDRGVVVEVRDTGYGIDDADIGAIFDPFFSTREMGLGLGLALCRRIIEEHRGELTAGTTPQGETVFRFRLPALTKTVS
jgi:two-component system, NtrC family, sensor histidine kinase PilS